MVSKELVISVGAILAAFVLINSVKTREGWRPFAWYGYPGVSKGQVGYQARGDWCGVDPATRTVDPPLPIIAPRGCA